MRLKNRKKALQNLAVTLILAIVIWAIEGYDLPTMEMEMHRAERRHMIEESWVIWEYEGIQYNDRDMIVGLGPKYVTTYHESYAADFWPRSVEEPTLVLLPESTRYNPTGSFNSYTDPAFIAVDAPARAQSARLSILLEYNEFSEVYTAQGEKQDTVWFFQLERRYYALNEDSTEAERTRRHNEESAFNVLEFFSSPDHFYYPYTLEFFDAEGELIEIITNSPQ